MVGRLPGKKKKGSWLAVGGWLLEAGASLSGGWRDWAGRRWARALAMTAAGGGIKAGGRPGSSGVGLFQLFVDLLLLLLLRWRWDCAWLCGGRAASGGAAGLPRGGRVLVVGGGGARAGPVAGGDK